MTDIQKKISDLEYRISMIDFQEHLSSEDYIILDSLHKELKELRAQLVPSGYYVILKLGFATQEIYFTGDKSLTCSSEPTYFESEDEALRLIKASYISDIPYEIRKVGE
jgi:hypothetical protein